MTLLDNRLGKKTQPARKTTQEDIASVVHRAKGELREVIQEGHNKLIRQNEELRYEVHNINLRLASMENQISIQPHAADVNVIFWFFLFCFFCFGIFF